MKCDERGLMLLFWAFAFLGIMSALVVVAEAGTAFVGRREAQNAADAAALAAAWELPDGGDATQAAHDLAEANGFEHGVDGATVIVVTPFNGDADLVEVTIEAPDRDVLGGTLNMDTGPISARAVARRNEVAGGGNYSFVVLDPTACQALYVHGTPQLIINGGGLMVNSSCSSGQGAIRRQGNSDIITAFNHHFEDGTISESGPGDFTPSPTAVDFQLTDPLAGLAIPNEPDSPDSGGSAAAPSTLQISGDGSITLWPGVYHGGINISGGKDVTLMSGTYVMAGGGFSANGNGDIDGTDVLIYNTSGPNAACDELHLSGDRQTNIDGPASGAYKDLVIWQDESCNVPMKLRGGQGATVGVIYVPGALLDLAGGFGLGAAQVITKTAELSGNGTIEIDATFYVSTGAPQVSVSLYE